MLTAITREINDAFGECELTFLPRVTIDIDLARHQHQQYQSALSSLGCDVVTVPTKAGLADSVFIEDTAMVLDEVAVALRPGAASRRPEVPGVEAILGRIFAGLSTRSNADGISQLRNIVADYGYSVETVETARCLHLTSAVTQIAPGTLLINPEWVDPASFAAYELVNIDEREPHAANALLVGTRLLYPASFPRTLDTLMTQGLDIVTLDLSELQKAEGAATCCSLIVRTG
jgi:dimethylargininase